MKLRRVLVGDELITERLDDEQWVAHDDITALGGSNFAPDRLREIARRHLRGTDALLPFQPLSFRDFLLFEQHNIDAGRGMMARFHPGLARTAAVVERLTRRDFPLYKPRPLFYRQPIYYMSNHLTFVPTGTPITPPSYTEALDFELELGFVLAAPLLDATPEQALAAIGAFVLVNDLSARDVQTAEMTSGLGPQKAKHFASSMSATAVTAEEILPKVGELTGSVRINGETVSTVTTAGMQWTIGEALAHASTSEQLLPGELFATGTLPGGSGMETGHWLAPGDTLTLTLDGIGDVEHRIMGR
ncbi:fumarylacetoacetate hydrolase family protein [Nocardia arizonensis]|uniref:fumarylacetoacetate hydrolase family protein n=1 Tax=Nocardia arizonensis TaxID=1141647 RepID=UPI0006D19445|nr:fumarylacetoacetate hydrolase family protein [Nocardia arizonensis]